MASREIFIDAADERAAEEAERLLRASGFSVRRSRHAVIAVGDLLVDAARHEVRLRGVPVPCTPTEFRALQALVERVGEVVSYHVLVDRAWRGQPLDRDAYLRPVISRLRRRLRDAGAQGVVIETVRGVGHRLRVGETVRLQHRAPSGPEGGDERPMRAQRPGNTRHGPWLVEVSS